MRAGFIIFLAAGAMLFHIYTDGKYWKWIMVNKKYTQMGAVVLGALFLYWMVTQDPYRAKRMVENSHEYLKYLPVDRETTSMMQPVLDLTSKYLPDQDEPYDVIHPVSSNRQRHKRSVSETKKKYVASKQGWKCGQCQRPLPAWFEVHHKTPLEDGGSNDISNLMAFCRDCHGEQTTLSNL